MARCCSALHGDRKEDEAAINGLAISGEAAKGANESGEGIVWKLHRSGGIVLKLILETSMNDSGAKNVWKVPSSGTTVLKLRKL
jgi:hypothetical protein